VSAARALHYRRVYEFTLPDGRHASLWYRQQRSLAVGTSPVEWLGS
jgi:hypothetical protein